MVKLLINNIMEAKTITINEFPVPEDMHFIMDLQHQTYDHPVTHRYFLAFDTEPETPVSVLWNDLEFISRHFGVTMFDKECDITDESLNKDRRANIADKEDMIARNLSPLDYHKIKENGKVNYEDNYGNPKTITYKAHINDDGNFVSERTESEYEPRTLHKDTKKAFKKDIARGLYVIGKYVRSVNDYQKRQIFKDEVLN